ncbi:hypothetical protein VTH06DRAFT_1779 [Thermothelomyces fergusii]
MRLVFGAYFFSRYRHHHGSGDFFIVTIKSLTVHGSTISKKKRISTYRTTSRRIGGRCLFSATWVFSIFWGTTWAIIWCRVGGKDNCSGFIVVGHLGKRTGASGPLYLASLVSWVDGGSAAIAAPILISFFILFLLSGFSWSCISDNGYRWKGETFAFLACLGPWVVWRLHLLNTYSELGSQGLVQHSGLGSGHACEALCGRCYDGATGFSVRKLLWDSFLGAVSASLGVLNCFSWLTRPGSGFGGSAAFLYASVLKRASKQAVLWLRELKYMATYYASSL